MDYSIETLTSVSEEDLKALYRLSKSYFDDYAELDKEDEIKDLREEHIENYFTAFINRQGRQASVARYNGRIVGYITYYEKQRQCFYKIESIGEISGFFVEKEYREKGIGTKLLERAKRFFTTRRIGYYSLFASIHDKYGIEYLKRNGMYENNLIFHGKIESVTD